MTFSSFLIALLSLTSTFLLVKLRSSLKDAGSLKVDLSLIKSDYKLLERNENKNRMDLIEKFNSINESYNSLVNKCSELEKHVKTLDDLAEIKRNIEIFEAEHDIVAAGLYSLYVPYETPDELKNQLEEKRVKLADMIRSKTAAICTTKWSINGSTAEGTKATKHYIRIMLRTFNADADSCLEMVRWNNFEKCIARIKASFEYVNKLGESHSAQIQPDYLQLRIEQLELMYRYKESLHQHKESMRVARVAAAEERRAQRELENARKTAEQEEIRYTRALERARSELQSLIGDEHSNMLQRIKELESELSKAVELKQRAISMAQITKAGFVYVVSNIGSFGPDVLKIGMTRRIDPKDRIRELGGASVPFGFDVHAMIYSEDAPNLENRFHRYFFRQRINLANGRKEFFHVSLLEVVKFAEKLSLKAEFTSEIEAKDFRLSDELRRTVLYKLTDDELQARIDSSVTDLPDEDAIEDEVE